MLGKSDQSFSPTEGTSRIGKSEKSNIPEGLSATKPGKQRSALQTPPRVRSESKMVRWMEGSISRYLFDMSILYYIRLEIRRYIYTYVFAATNPAHPAPMTTTLFGIAVMEAILTNFKRWVFRPTNLDIP
jgi:hypothetical protein